MAVGMILIPASVYADEESRQESKPIIIGTELDYPPYSFLNEDGEPTGFNVELTRAITEVMELNVEIKIGPWGEIREALEIGNIDAISGQGKLKIKTRGSDDFVEIIFNDDGEGIPQENLNKIFEPLFTTKAKGIGLGLAIVKNIIDHHNGKIEVESEVGKGTTFIIKLPIKIQKREGDK